MQVARLDDVAVGHADATDSRGREVLQDRHAETARADHQHRAVLQPCLAFASDLRQRHS